MAVCVDCGANISLMRHATFGICIDCANPNVLRQEKIATRNTETEAILLTTETAPNLNITKRIEIVTAECALV